MSVNLKQYHNELLFVPLGGSNEIGANFNLYHYQGKWLIVDCGSGFADDYLPGVDMMVPDPTFIENNKKDIVGLILTHAHEDHLGAVQYLWQDLGCQIYATDFTASFLKAKLAEFDSTKNIKINKVKPGSSLNLAPFAIEFVPLTHSAPEMQALMIRTEKGNILHTGDWKFDPDPIVGNPSDLATLKKCGDEGVLALVCDSTNVFSPGRSGSEGELRKSLVKIISECPNMVVVTTFASNLGRVESLVHAAKLAGRKLVISGRSMRRIVDVAHGCGYLEDLDHVIDERDIGRFKRSEILILATGCQGEPLAAIAKMANNSHPLVKLAEGDTIIFSSKIIPGNDKKIFRLFNLLVHHKVEVITERDHFVHVSGHPNVEELKQMYDLVRPQICIPVHGEPVHIHEHAKIAKAHGIKQTIEPENGDVSLLSSDAPEIVGKVTSGYLAVDGHSLLPTDSNIFKMRRRMRDEGLGIITILIGKNHKLATSPIIDFPGCLDHAEDRETIKFISNAITEEINSFLRSHKNISRDQIETKIRSLVRGIIRADIGKNPMLNINVEYLSEK